jgi:two-component system phosphate regulon sensor histidine kinase PhoR
MRFSLVLAAAMLIGWWQGNVVLYLVLALLAYSSWHLWHLARFEQWIKAGAREDAPELGGIWGELVSIIIQIKRKSRDRKQRYKALLREFRKSTGVLPDGTVLLNPHNEILWFNRAAANMLALRKGTDRMQSIENFIRAPEFVDYLRAGDRGAPIVMAAPHDAGHYYSMKLVSYGQDQRLLLIRDVTSEVNSERLRRDFVANASHELRSPLTVLTGYLDAMDGDPQLNDMWREPVRQMQTQTARMTAIVTDLLHLSRLESAEAQSQLEETEVDVAALLARVRSEAMAHPSCPGHVSLHLDSSARLMGSEADLYSAFSNLVDNAVKYTPGGGRIDIRWQVDEAGGSVSVSDSGAGIDAAEIPRITERFYRVDRGRSRDEGGTGLGLSIVKHVMQCHGGHLEIQSRPGHGSTFTCRFPPARIVESKPGSASHPKSGPQPR